jgi:molybdopterin-guanine dinucleotide biosynthesis protein A
MAKMTGLILAGGQSRRMGQPKALLPWGDGLLIDAVVARLQPVVDEVLIVAKEAAPFLGRGARVVTDLTSESHPWVGVCTGLRLATYEVSFVCACDMPWLNPAVIRYLSAGLERFEAVVPQGPSGLEPFHAVYTRRCVPTLERCWEAGHRTFQAILRELSVRIVTGQELRGFNGWERSFMNLNTPEEVSRGRDGRLG